MNDGIIGLQGWFETPAGRYLLAWEQEQYQLAVADIFGYHALQLGLPALNALEHNRMPHRWLASVPGPAAPSAALPTALQIDYAALPFPESSLDLVVLPHTLDSHAQPHAVLREVARVLVPGGRVALSGFNPVSLWGLRQWQERLCRPLRLGTPLLPQAWDFIGSRRLRDWLHLLDFEIETGRYGCYRPLLASDAWLHRWRWLEQAGVRWWPFFGAAYMLVAVKRVHGVRLLGPAWKTPKSRASTRVPLAGRSEHGQRLQPPGVDGRSE